jgi:EAL domain-containing protein (putative c-di-GMP-specific phosphodiesterase class I)
VQAIVALGKAMNLEIVAEGIETEKQLELVTRFGCDLAQGFLIAKPMPETEFLAWCEARNASAPTGLRASSAGSSRRQGSAPPLL